MKTRSYIIFLIICFLSLGNNSFAKIETKIILKIGDEIITNYEVKNKILRTLFLSNQDISQSNINTLKKRSLESLIQMKLKTIELSKYKIKMFTILRHPHERICSNYKFFKSHDIIPRATCNNNKNEAEHEGNKCCTSNALLIDYLERVLIKNPEKIDEKESCPFNGDEWKMKTFMDNEMTYQLGNIMYAFQRNVKPEVAVERGKKFLDAMDFIGFYEDWNTDFHRLKKEIFHDLDRDGTTWLQWFRQEIFYIGTIVSRNRMRTFKYSGAVYGESRKLMEEATKYDMEIYKYARRKMGRSEDGGLYKSYNEWMLKELLPFGIVFSVLFFAICRLCCFSICCNKKKEWECSKNFVNL